MSRNNLKVFNIQYVIPHTQEVFTCKALGIDYNEAERLIRETIFNQLKARGINCDYNSCIEVTNRAVYCGVDLISNDTYEYFKNDNKVQL